MVYGIVQLINFAHGEIYMFGAAVGLFLVTVAGFSLFPAMLGAMLFCMLLGVLVERVAYRPLRGKSSRLSALISAIGVSIFLSTLMLLIAGPNTRRYPEVIDGTIFRVGSLELSSMQIIILVVAAVLMIGLQLMIKTRLVWPCGRLPDLDAAYLMGINASDHLLLLPLVRHWLRPAVMVGVYYNAIFPMGTMAGLKAFSAAVLGNWLHPGACWADSLSEFWKSWCSLYIFLL